MFKNITKRALSTTSILNRKYGGRQTAVLIPGDGFGTEMSNYLLQIFKKMQAPVDFEKLDINKADWLEPAGAGSDERAGGIFERFFYEFFWKSKFFGFILAQKGIL